MSSPEKEKLTLIPYFMASAKLHLHASLKNKLWQFASIRTLKDVAEENKLMEWQLAASSSTAGMSVVLKEDDLHAAGILDGQTCIQVSFVNFPYYFSSNNDYKKWNGNDSQLTYAVTFKGSEMTGASSWDAYFVNDNQINLFSIIKNSLMMWAASDTTSSQSSGATGPPSSGDSEEVEVEEEEEEEEEQEKEKKEKNDTDHEKKVDGDVVVEEGEGKKDKETDKNNNERKISIYKEKYMEGRVLYQFFMSSCNGWEDFLIQMHKGYKEAEFEYAKKDGEAITMPSPPLSPSDSVASSSQDSEKYPKTLDDVFPNYEIMYVALNRDPSGLIRFTTMDVEFENLNDIDAWIHFRLALNHIVVCRHAGFEGEMPRRDIIFIMDQLRMSTIVAVQKSNFERDSETENASKARFRGWLLEKHKSYMKTLGKEPSTNVNEHSLDKVWPGFKISYRGQVFGRMITKLRLPRTASGWRFFIKHLCRITVKQLDVITVSCDTGGESPESLFVMEKKDCRNPRDFFVKLNESWGRIDIESARCKVEDFHGRFVQLDIAEHLYQWAKEMKERDQVVVDPVVWENLIWVLHEIVVKEKRH